MLAESFDWSTTVSAQTYLLRHGKPSTCPGSLCELAAAAVVTLEASAAMSFACVQQKHLWSSGYDVSLTR